MPSPGLSRGARILRRCRRSSRIGAIHPWRAAAIHVLSIPLFVVLLVLYLLGLFGEYLSGLKAWIEIVAEKKWSLIESPREIDLHRRAWNSRAKKGTDHA